MNFTLFMFNFILAIADVSLGWHVAPRLLRRETGSGVVRGMLAGVVGFYAFLNCLAYARGSETFLLVVTALLLLDLAGQLLAGRRLP